MNNPLNTVLELKSFYLNPKWREFVSSMLYEAGTEVASSTWEYNGEIARVSLVVNGKVRVAYKGKEYDNPILFPLELRQRIKDRPHDWERSDEGKEYIAYVDEENWFEYAYSNRSNSEIFYNDVSKTEPARFKEDMFNIVVDSFPDFTEVKFPKYVLEGYDKDNDAYIVYARSNDLEEIKEWACEYIPVVTTDKLIRKCSDGSIEPMDDILITDTETEEKIWNTGDLLTFRLCLDVKFSKPVSEDDWVSLGGFDFDFNGQSIRFDFEEVSGGRLDDKSIVRFETRNPDYKTFPRMALLTKELLQNVTSVNEIYYETDDFPEDEDFLQPVEVLRGAFVLIEDDAEGKTGLTEIPIPALTNCDCHFYGG